MSQLNANYRLAPSVPPSDNFERSNDPAQDVLDSTREVSDVCPFRNQLMKNIPRKETHTLANSYIGSARILSYILLVTAVLVLVACGYSVHRAMTFPDKEQYGYTTIMPSFVLASGECDYIGRLSDGLLLLVNIIGGVCLGISSYLQQLCTSPTREDFSTEMKVHGDVNFGGNSPSSLFRRMRKRKVICILWVFLLITSLPAHLLLNGSIGVAPTWLSLQVAAVYQNMTSQYIVGDQITWTNISNKECNDILFQMSQVGYGNYDILKLTVVIDPSPGFESFLFQMGYNATEISAPPTWNESESYILVGGLLMTQQANDLQIPYCLAEIINEECGVVVRWLPLVIFSSALAVKAIVACLALHLLQHFKKRLYNTLGDVIFLAVENPEFKIPNESLASKRKLSKSYMPANGVEVCATRKHKPWARFLGKGDWIVYFLLICGVAGVWVLVGYNLWMAGSGYKFTWTETGFGLNSGSAMDSIDWTPQGDNMLTSTDIFAAVIAANIPQICISIAYLLFNNQISRLWQEREWRSFYLKRKLPRTGIKSGPGTRSTRWLQLPYLLSALLIAVSVCLHWLASQAVFLIESYEQAFRRMSIILYVMPLPAIVLACIWTALVLTITIIYFVPQRSPMPVMCGSARVVLASCCSVVELHKDGIMWGDITGTSGSSKRKAGFSQKAGIIREGELYL